MEPAFSRAWFETFGRPDPADTQREVQFLLGVLPRPPATVLDVPCGFGRHATALGEHGYRVTGVERDPAVAREARAAGIDVRELDMRELGDLRETFDAVICMWASFGWFDDASNAEVLAAMAAHTARGGTAVLDLYDPAFFRSHQGVRLNRGVRDTKVVRGNRLQTTLEYADGRRNDFEWRLYTPDELRALGRAAGLELQTLCSGFDRTAAPAGDAPRIQAVFRHAPRWENLTRRRRTPGGAGQRRGGAP